MKIEKNYLLEHGDCTKASENRRSDNSLAALKYCNKNKFELGEIVK